MTVKRTLVIAVLIAAGPAAYIGWPTLSATIWPQPVPQANAEAGLSRAPDVRFRFALIDPTTSTGTGFRDSMKGFLVDSVRSYVPAKPEVTNHGVGAVTGLDLVVRLVGTKPLQYGAPEVHVSVPSVPALPARPDMTAQGALDPSGPYDHYKDAAATWSEQYDAALYAASSAAASLEAMNLNLDEYSAVTAGVASLSLLAPKAGDVAYLVASDLGENVAQETAALNGSPILLIQPDPLGNQGTWNALYLAFQNWAKANSAGTVDRVRPEAAGPAIAAFLKGA